MHTYTYSTGRKFYGCNDPKRKDCKFFLWVDEVDNNKELVKTITTPRKHIKQSMGNLTLDGVCVVETVLIGLRKACRDDDLATYQEGHMNVICVRTLLDNG